jgi:putative nucleotidyltransferase with HDIG domain
LTTITALIAAKCNNYRSFFLSVFLAPILVSWLLNINLIYRTDDLSASIVDAGWIILSSSFVAAAIALTLLFIFEVVCNISTNMSLMVLCDCNHPLLERLKREAPGTMAHSMAVATLSEDAAKAVKANPLLAKAGAFFHDIGKLEMPQYFTENNPESARQHLNLNPQMSSIIIRDHVKEGIVLARKHRLCREIREIIANHHGDDLVSYFYAKVLENAKIDGVNPPVIESQFRYTGNPPRGAEATIISLADACEAASRSLEHPTPERIRDLVNKIFSGRFNGGQLRNSRLSLANLEKVRESFINTLISARHGRVSYEESTQDDTALQMEQPAAAESQSK